MKGISTFCAVLLLAAGTVVHGMERLDGVFVASEACAAFQSKNRRTNPGGITLEPKASYQMRGTNAPARDWYQITIPGAPGTPARWVHVNCGVHRTGPDTASASPEARDMVLALTWQPAFCEAKPGVSECLALNAGRLPHTERQLSLHGLWPQPRSLVYCDVPTALVSADTSGEWDKLPDLTLSIATRDRLAKAMPGSASHLDRHEWIKHGTCYEAAQSGEGYYADSLALLDAINASVVGHLFRDARGQELTSARIARAFDDAFGPGAGQRVQTTCAPDQKRVLIREIRIHLRGDISDPPDLTQLMLAAPSQDPGCRTGHVDRAGLQ